ncbi:phosphomevalonate kinase [Schumannella sp. 10F1B-5-1]|uniref:phosphomevalonate kinase n=1 Tax=Schumannella sp. 10F1B-5-1 TaxID=2590780 RepID=UPI001130CD26|nr:phosphomevalonate kinase [Schumannella sp. 10F1B-5-1]TPW71506.1 phosphomevalonate kinase [Schumannella sp. 10F1B-5-1]
MIEMRAPGKLFIAGEYAVVEPGQPSVLIAVDRYLTVTLTESRDAGSVHSPEYGQIPLVWRRDDDGLTLDREHHPYDYVMSVLATVEQLRGELGIPARFYDLRVQSELDDASGRKFGLGSSAAVVVATVHALDRFYGLGLTRRERFKLGLLATIQVSPNASGGDVAASTFGGWIRYSAPDRSVLREQLGDRSVSAVLNGDGWAGFDMARLAPPHGLRLLVGWTGSPASTERLVGGVRRRRIGADLDYPAFLLESRACVDDLVTGLDDGDDTLALDALRRSRRLLQRLGAQSGTAIETDRLARLCDTAEAAGAAGKPSGAGGGDCGIVLAPADADLTGMLRSWESHDIRHLTISVHPPEGSVDD